MTSLNETCSSLQNYFFQSLTVLYGISSSQQRPIGWLKRAQDQTPTETSVAITTCQPDKHWIQAYTIFLNQTCIHPMARDEATIFTNGQDLPCSTLFPSLSLPPFSLFLQLTGVLAHSMYRCPICVSLTFSHKTIPHNAKPSTSPPLRFHNKK